MRLVFVFVLVIASLSVFGQVDTLSLNESSRSYMDAFLAEDYDAMAEMTHPNILSLGGGKKFVAMDLKTDRTDLESMGMQILDGKVGLFGEMYTAGRELLCFVPLVYTVSFKGKKYHSEVPILASSSSNGKIWKFVSLSRFDQESIKSFIPNYDSNIPWPDHKPLVPID